MYNWLILVFYQFILYLKQGGCKGILYFFVFFFFMFQVPSCSKYKVNKTRRKYILCFKSDFYDVSGGDIQAAAAAEVQYSNTFTKEMSS